MSDKALEKAQSQRSWLDRLSHALLREPKDREQLVELLRDAEQRDLLDADALSMIEGVLQVNQMQVRDIMIPRAHMVSIRESEALETFLPEVIESAHSRIPVMGDGQEQVIGILHAKDLLQFTLPAAAANFNIRNIVRPAIVVPESKRLDALLKEFRVNQNHMAIVVDEYGNISGLVTIEDVLEQIVGEIEDEFDVAEDTYIKKYSSREYIIKALTPLEEFNHYFNSDFNEDEYDTIGGLVMHALGHVPHRGENIVITSFKFRVLHADKRRIHLLRLQLEPNKQQTV